MVVLRAGHLLELVLGAVQIVGFVVGRDADHPATVPAAVTIQSPPGRHGTVVLVCLSSMPVLLRNASGETDVDGDSCQTEDRA
jgi:hypothetical protein